MEKAAECLVKVSKVVEKKNINLTVGYCSALATCSW